MLPFWLGMAGLGTPAVAGTPYEIASGPAMATGGAAAAHAHDNTALTMNPAAMALTPRYAITANGGFFDRRDGRFGGTAVDGLTTGGFALGLGYQRSYLSVPLVTSELPGWGQVGEEPHRSRRFDTFALGFGVPLIKEKLSLGASGTLVVIGHPIRGNVFTGNATAGFAARPSRRWAVGVAGRNLIPIAFPTDPSASVVLGNRVAWTENRSIMLDVEVPISLEGEIPVIGRTGAEWGDESKVFGVGYRFVGPLQQHWVTAGFGLISDSSTSDRPSGTRGTLHYAIEIPAHPMDEGKGRIGAMRHTLTISILPDIDRNRPDNRW
jgi:hypothetical protein